MADSSAAHSGEFLKDPFSTSTVHRSSDTTWTPRINLPTTSAEHGSHFTPSREDTGVLRSRAPQRKAATDGMMLGYHKDANPRHFMTMQRRQLSPTKLPASQKQGAQLVPTFDTRLVPRKGKGRPPTEGREAVQVIKDHHLADIHSPRRDILGQREFQGIEADRRSKGKRTTFERQAVKDSLLGGAAVVGSDNQEDTRRHWRPVTARPGSYSSTFDRIMGTGPGPGYTKDHSNAAEEAGPGSPRQFGRRVAIDGRGADHREMLTHRLSNGGTVMAQIMGRTGAPQTEAKSGATMKQAYNEARQDYNLNRVHAMGCYD